MLCRFWSFYIACNELHNLHVHGMSRMHRELLVSWKHPPDGWVKVNSDGLVLANHKVTCSGLLKDALGHFLRCFAACLGLCPVMIAKLRCIFYALDMAWLIGFGFVILEVDSFCAMQLLHKPRDLKHPHGALICRIHSFLWRD